MTWLTARPNRTVAAGVGGVPVGKRIQYDGHAGRVTNDTAANELLSREYRKGWKLDG